MFWRWIYDNLCRLFVVFFLNSPSCRLNLSLYLSFNYLSFTIFTSEPRFQVSSIPAKPFPSLGSQRKTSTHSQSSQRELRKIRRWDLQCQMKSAKLFRIKQKILGWQARVFGILVVILIMCPGCSEGQTFLWWSVCCERKRGIGARISGHGPLVLNREPSPSKCDHLKYTPEI